MDFTLSEEQNLLIKTTESFVKSELVQHENLLEKTNNLPKELYDEIKKKSIEVGLYACNMPKEHGGGGLNAFDLTLVEKALGYTSLALAEIAWRPQNILMACKGDLINEYLKPSTSGERKDCIACISPHRAGVVNIPNSDTQTDNIVDYYSPLQSSSYAVFDSGYK